MAYWRDILRAARGRLRYLPAWWSGRMPRSSTSVFYGHPRIPDLGQLSHGGMTKIQYLHQYFPNSPARFNLLYLVSSIPPADWAELLRFVRSRKAKLIWNQDGVAYPAWYGEGWEKLNHPMRTLLHRADFVIYQSEFCRASADRYLGETTAPSKLIYNAVDTKAFAPSSARRDHGGLVALTTGSILEFYRYEAAVNTISHARKLGLNIRLLVAGRLAWREDREQCLREAYGLLDNLGLREHVTLLPPYSQREAPDVYRRAQVFLHTKHNDPCPTTVIEAMASGLPVVYSHSGGVPELVGEHAGVGVPVPLDWERIRIADPGAMAKAIVDVMEDWQQYSTAARDRATARFDIREWLAAHTALFEMVLGEE
jgi:glycosyltransferase involved in cell wall biosynthesis